MLEDPLVRGNEAGNRNGAGDALHTRDVVPPLPSEVIPFCYRRGEPHTERDGRVYPGIVVIRIHKQILDAAHIVDELPGGPQ